MVADPSRPAVLPFPRNRSFGRALLINRDGSVPARSAFTYRAADEPTYVLGVAAGLTLVFTVPPGTLFDPSRILIIGASAQVSIFEPERDAPTRQGVIYPVHWPPDVLERDAAMWTALYPELASDPR